MQKDKPHVCPVWAGYLLAHPLRRLWQDPRSILGPYLSPGMTALDVGCAMGFFSLPLAQLVGPEGKVICVDLQEKMLRGMERRARRAGLAGRIEARLCAPETLGLAEVSEAVDFALLFAVVHEVPDAPRLFREIHRALKPSARLLVAEPRGHVSPPRFEASVAAAGESGFAVSGRPRIRGSRAVLLSKPALFP